MDDDDAAVRAAAQRYIDACADADGAALRAALHPQWTMYGIDSGATDVAVPVDEFVGWVDDQKPPQGYRAVVTRVEIAGDAAIATLVEENYYGTDYVIFLSMIRYDGAWSVTTKTHSQMPPVIGTTGTESS